MFLVKKDNNTIFNYPEGTGYYVCFSIYFSLNHDTVFAKKILNIY